MIMLKQRKQSKIQKLTWLKLLFVLVSGLVFLVSISSCSEKIAGDSINLEFVPGQTNDTKAVDNFDETGCIVLRCSTLTVHSNGIQADTSKSKNMKAKILVFINIPGTVGEEYYQAAVAPITGREYEYDMTEASFYTVTAASADTSIFKYGISYADWQAGAINSSESFPCCE
jgi:hypothetical protein